MLRAVTGVHEPFGDSLVVILDPISSRRSLARGEHRFARLNPR
jgi:hypothetical protein